ncbi:MAG: FliG C-terminal domain-containing protein, partial [Elusimicrobiota bacterium]
EFLRRLPSDFSSEVISSMATVRFVEAEVVMTIKEELERRLAGAFGGVSKVLESLNRVNLSTKKEMLEKLASRHPDIARDVRSKIFLAEDLLRFSERDLSLLASTVKPDDWACALWDLSPEFKEKLRKQLAEKAWQILEQTMKYGSPSREKTSQAIETIVGAALALIKEGKLSNPLESPMEPMIETAAAPKGA